MTEFDARASGSHHLRSWSKVRKLLAVLASLFLLASFATPAQSASAKYMVKQKTLATFSGSSTSLTYQQRSQVKAAVEANPFAEKFICTGIRYYSQPMSVNIMVRKRAKAACAYAKQLNPNLSTWYQNKPTKARSYAGKVLLTVKSPAPAQDPSPSSVEACKLLDTRSAAERALSRGQQVNGVIGKNNIGFPVTDLGNMPTMGKANIIVAKVAWRDAPPDPRLPDNYLQIETKKLADLSRFWSQGKFEYEFQIVEEWIEVDADHADYSLNNFEKGTEHEEDVYARAAKTYEEIARLVVANLPDDLDYAAADQIVAYMSPTISEFALSIGWSNGLLDTPDGPLRIPFMANGNNRTGQKHWPNTWLWLAHDFLHYQGLNEHAPGNGWSTSIQGGAYVTETGRSPLLSVWDSFLLGWIDDDQVFCAEKSALDQPMQTALTPLELSGGDLKTAIVPLGEGRAIVIESRRPVGYSSSWPKDFYGLLVYEIDVDAIHVDHGTNYCTNSRENPKWAYYLLPDGAVDKCNNPEPYFVRLGDTLTFDEVRVTLNQQTSSADYISIERLGDD